jgi:transcriptional regulator with XRE-family HTH domain
MKEKPEKIRRILAQNVKKRRENLGLTQENLAEKTDLSVQTINTIEGCRMWISDKSVTRLAKALNMEIFQLFMPHQININESNPEYRAVLQEFWQKTKLAVDNLSLQIDDEFKDVLQQRKNEKETPKKPVKSKAKRSR